MKQTLTLPVKRSARPLRIACGLLLSLSLPNIVQADWPVAVVDTETASTNSSIVIRVLDNDIGEGLRLTSVNTTTKKLGSASMNADGKSVSYQSAANFVGTDSFWYDFKDSQGRTNAAKVTVTVTDYSGWPVAKPDRVAVTSTTTIAIPVLDNDFGKDLKLTKVGSSTEGLGEPKIEENHIRYTPKDGVTGEDSFWYNFKDARGRENSTQVFVDVSQNTKLSSIEFCGSTYTTDGTANNTKVSSQDADANAIEIDLSVEKSPTTDSGNFNVGEYRYFAKNGFPDNKLWVADRETGANAREVAAEEKLYILGSRNGVLYYAYNTFKLGDRPNTHVWIVVARDNNKNTTIGELSVSVVGARINLLDNTTELFFETRAIYDSRFYKHNETSNSITYVTDESAPGFAGYSNYVLESLISHNGFNYPGYAVSNVDKNYSYYVLGKFNRNNTSEEVLGRRGKTVISNDRLLLTTQASTNITSEGTKALPATLYTATKDNKLIELAVCGNSVDGPAVATPDSVSVTSSAAVTITPLSNDTGSGLVLQAPNIWSQLGGNVAMSGSTLSYTPKPGFNGTDRIFYSIRDSQDRGDWSTITITVSGNDGENYSHPVAKPDAVSIVTSSTPFNILPLRNDTGSGLILQAPNAWSQQGGKVSKSGKMLTYTPKSGFTGTDRIFYSIRDSRDNGTWSTITITVTGN